MKNNQNKNLNEEFRIMEFMRFMLIFRILVPVFFAGVMLFAAQDPYLKLSDQAPLILGGLMVWFIYEISQFNRWYNFRVGMAEDGVWAGKEFVRWEEMTDVEGKTAAGFSPFIFIHRSEGEKISIPAAISEKHYILGVLQNHMQQKESLDEDTVI